MDGTKDWWASKTIWSDLTTVITGLCVSFHALTADQAAALNAGLPALIVGLVTIGLGLWGLYGRIVATKMVV